MRRIGWLIAERDSLAIGDRSNVIDRTPSAFFHLYLGNSSGQFWAPERDGGKRHWIEAYFRREVDRRWENV